MNKNDIKLLLIIGLIIIISFSCLLLFKDNSSKYALVYYEDEVILKIDLSLKGEHEYKVNGYNGEIVIKTQDSKIKVSEENSPLHICSSRGWIEESYEVLVCLPNKVVIKIETEDEIDTVVK